MTMVISNTVGDNFNQQIDATIAEVSRIATYLWEREWAEKNSGNISIDVSELIPPASIQINTVVPCSLPSDAANLTLLMTGAGCHLRTLIHHPARAACLLHINSTASGYSILWGGDSPAFKPTSELLSHVKLHAFNRLNHPTHKAVLHTHPIELIVLSHHDLFNDEDKFNHSLWKMCPEVRVFIPKGVCCAPYQLPGSDALANVTIRGLQYRNVVLWEKHGALATGATLEQAFDYLDVANKGAKLLLLAWAAGFEPKGLTQTEMTELEQFI